MNLIREIEISYFRSFYKARLSNLDDFNVIFGKNDSGKSNVIRALNLFFNGKPDYAYPFEFPLDFCQSRASEASSDNDIRKFLYVKITFNTPKNFQPSLGKIFSVKRQWTVSRGQAYNEEFSNNIPANKYHIATRFLNKIRFIHIPAIKDSKIFEQLLGMIHETLSNSTKFVDVVEQFSESLKELTENMFSTLPGSVTANTKIGAPSQLEHLFQTLDFETEDSTNGDIKSLTRQRGDGIKVRHIPELLSYISQNDNYSYHIWGFEEPENSLDFVASQAEAKRLSTLSNKELVQIFVTTHSPSFYLLSEDNIKKYYVKISKKGSSEVHQGKDMLELTPENAMEDGFWLPSVAEALRGVNELKTQLENECIKNEKLNQQMNSLHSPVILTEGKTDAIILNEAWKRRKKIDCPFIIQSCETMMEDGGNGGASSLAARLKGVDSDSPKKIIGVFDYDAEGIKSFGLNKNFKEFNISGHIIKKSANNKCFATLLPTPAFRKTSQGYKNIPIEYFFNDSDLDKSVNGIKLELSNIIRTTTVGDHTFSFDFPETEICLKQITGNKLHFAEKIVPTLDDESFEAFDALFVIIEKILEYQGEA